MLIGLQPLASAQPCSTRELSLESTDFTACYTLQVTLTKRTAIRYLWLLLVSFTVGLAVAFAVALFKEMVHLVSTALYGNTGFAAPDLITHSYLSGHPYILGLPAAGGLAVGFFIHKTRQKYGVPETVASAANKGGAIPAHAGLHTTMANSLSLGSGASAGSEGPLVQIGSAVGSLLGGIARLSKRNRTSALAAGGAASFAVLFGAPLAGMCFAMEVILRNFRLKDVAPLAIAAFTAVVASNILGVTVLHANVTPPDAIATMKLIAPAVVLAFICALAGVSFVRLTHIVTRYTQRRKAPVWFCTTVGGVCVGVIAWFFPQVLGIGGSTLGTLLAEQNSLGLLLLTGLVFAKIIATGITLGSGIPGGCLFPSLFIGATAGAAVGEGLQAVLPGTSATFALVGAASVLAVVVRAPLAGISLVISVIPSFSLGIITAVTAIAAMGISRRLGGISMYSPALAAQGVPHRSAYAHLGPLLRKIGKYPRMMASEAE